MALKTALLISGHRRSIKHTAPNIVALAEELGADIFIHTWSDAEMQAATWRVPGCYDGVGDVHDDLAILAAKSVWVEDAQAVAPVLVRKLLPDGIGSTLHGSCFMVYGMRQALACLEAYEAEHGVRYDVLMRYRFDLLAHNLPSLQPALEAAANDVVLMAEHNWLACADIWFDGVLIASAANYRRIMQALERDYAVRYYQLLATGVAPLPEHLISSSIQAQSLTIQPLAASFGLVRANGVVEQHFSPSHCRWSRDVCSLSILLERVAAGSPAEMVIWQALQQKGLAPTVRLAGYLRYVAKHLLRRLRQTAHRGARDE